MRKGIKVTDRNLVTMMKRRILIAAIIVLAGLVLCVWPELMLQPAAQEQSIR